MSSPWERESDERLLSAAGQDPAAFGAFYRRHEARMLVLSRPWRPKPWNGEPIRFFYALVDQPPGTRAGRFPLRIAVR